MTPAEYLKRPYARIVVPESDGSFRAEILEFPGCLALGDTAAEAFANLEEVAVGWIKAALKQKQRIPEPAENVGYSGKLVVRLPRSLHKQASMLAERDGVSLNQFIVASIAQQVGRAEPRHVISQFRAMLQSPMQYAVGMNQTTVVIHSSYAATKTLSGADLLSLSSAAPIPAGALTYLPEL